MNKSHKSGLEPLLKYRKSIEEQRRIELTNLMDKELIENQRLDDIRESQRLAQKELQAHKGKSNAYMMYLDDLSKQSVIQKNVIKDVKDKVITKREQVVEASKTKKTIEKVQSKRLEQYNQFLLRQESKMLDEIATNRFTRKDS